ncbi:MAG TPA: EAL domain-containing protein [Herbaspirillum sp.]|uniref:EAL domain-containing protein n=1 Tax=Herbaspirillum sp. TaxID=1890675 RepID=UPI002D66EE43|nr:EAL domain-containing protein [Herbaspirillum sp.]HZG21710.1 EAL domain-containing protein [Herbaspirillum sp.]
MNRKIFRRVSAWKILLWACLSMLGGMLLAQLALTVAELRHIDASSVQALQRAEDAARATGQALRRAEASPFDHCSEADLTVLRNITYANSYVADLARIDQGKVRCTALWGKLAQPFQLPAPHYQAGPGFDIWLRQEIVHTHSPSNLVALRRSLALTAPTTFDLNRFYQDVSLRITNGDGTRVLVEREGIRYNPAGAIGLLPAVDVTHCNSAMALCAQATARLHWYPVLYPLGLLAVLAGSFVVGALACLLHLRSRRHHSVLDRLRHGIANDEIALMYQPIVCISDRRLKGYEALARWRPADEPEIGPDIFVPLAAQNRLSSALAKAVLARALREMQDLLQADPTLMLAVNTEVADIEDPDFIRFALNLTAPLAALRPQLHLEVTERADIRSTTFTHNIELLRRAGFAIWIDDFGTGSANLSHLSYARFDGIKIDRLFTNALSTGSPLRQVLPNLLRLADELDLQVVIEGIESEEQLQLIRSIAPDIHAQGWLFSKALELAEVLQQRPSSANDELGLAA